MPTDACCGSALAPSNSAPLSVLSVRAVGAVLLFLVLVAPALTQAQDWIYTVRPGDNLWDLTNEHLTHMKYWRRLQALNKVCDPEHMPPGRWLRIPIAWLKIQPAAVQVVDVRGEVKATGADSGNRLAVTAGMSLRAGDEIQTGADGSAALEFGDGSRLLMQGNSRLIMDTLSAFGATGMVDTRMRLQHGRVDSTVTPRQGPGTPRYQISTPAAVSAVRGTRYRMSAEIDEPVSRTEVLAGEVVLRGAGKTRRVPASFGTVARAGQAPLPPLRLLGTPDVSRLPKVLGRVPIQIAFPPLQGASAYRAQISPDPSFNALLLDATSRQPRVRGPDLPDGEYFLRLRAIDKNGLEGLDAYHRFTLKARPEPPFLAEPLTGAVVREKVPTFQWSEPERATGYHFQLSGNERFDAPILDIGHSTRSRVIPEQALSPGFYFWRVATQVAQDEGPFSDTQGFKLQPAPASPALQPPAVERAAMVFRWSAGLPGQRYQFQLAHDSGFEQVVVDTTVAEPQVRIARPESGYYYLRVRTADVDGYMGPYGPAQRISVPPASYWPLVVFAVIIVVLVL